MVDMPFYKMAGADGRDGKVCKYHCRRYLLMILVLIVCVPKLCIAQVSEKMLGPLFTTAAERHTLSRLRDQGLVQKATGKVLLKKTQQKTGPNAIVLNGMVKRSNGDKVIWINGEQVNGRQGPAGVKLLSSGSGESHVFVAAPGKRSVELKPGQRLQIDNGKVEEHYKSRANRAEESESK